MTKYRSLAISVALATSLAACARPNLWNLPPGGTEAQFHRDNLECQMIARAVVGDQFVMGAPMYVAIASAVHKENTDNADRECLLGKGYILTQRGR